MDTTTNKGADVWMDLKQTPVNIVVLGIQTALFGGGGGVGGLDNAGQTGDTHISHELQAAGRKCTALWIYK